MKKIAFLLFIFCATQVFSQDMEALKASALRDAKATAEATLKQDFKTLLTYSHPNIVEGSGGAEFMENYLIQSFEQMKTQGFAIESAEVKFVSDVVKEQGEYRCYVQNKMVMSVKKKRFFLTGYTIGFFNESTKKWTFVEAKQMKDTGNGIPFFPNFKTSMNIPENTTEIKDIKE
ncbi:hypothetical protein [uncultured Kordia sp.]|uniref:hypothetical protein n=1 Tax=uncultured Kordia sp. TaxID=507699 RepID=UPI00260B2F93|nr:hypothetical protein [uncultured Kordia sp.]